MEEPVTGQSNDGERTPTDVGRKKLDLDGKPPEGVGRDESLKAAKGSKQESLRQHGRYRRGENEKSPEDRSWRYTEHDQDRRDQSPLRERSASPARDRSHSPPHDLKHSPPSVSGEPTEVLPSPPHGGSHSSGNSPTHSPSRNESGAEREEEGGGRDRNPNRRSSPKRDNRNSRRDSPARPRDRDRRRPHDEASGSRRHRPTEAFRRRKRSAEVDERDARTNGSSAAKMSKNDEADDWFAKKRSSVAHVDPLKMRSGGAYIPPAKMKMLQDQIGDKSRYICFCFAL